MSEHPNVHLPPQTTSFIGRADEIVEIAQRLNDPDCCLLTLVGPGGIGKTRLAIEVAEYLASKTGTLSLTNGIYFVNLQPVSNNDVVVTAIANTLGIMLAGSEPPREQLLSYLSGRQSLLILDNFEQLLDGINLLTDIVKIAPGVKLLVTSREALNIQEEWLWKLGGLDVPEHQPGASIESYSAAQLYVERAQHIHQNFSLTGQDVQVARICQLVEGLPLALELAASWTKVLSCAEIANAIQHSLDFLTTNLRNVPERHRNMQAVFEQSWRLLTDEERAVFPKLSVFRGGFRWAAAEQVAGASLSVLSGLVDKSFVHTDGQGRYDIHELMRQYGEQRLEKADAIRDAHSAYYLQFLADLEADIKGRRQLEAVNEIDADFENVRAAWLWAINSNNRDGIDRALECLHWFCEYRARLLDHEELLGRAEKRFAPNEGEMPSLIWAKITNRLVDIRATSGYGDEEESQILCAKALSAAQEYGDQAEIANSLRVRGLALTIMGKPGSLPLFEKVLNIYQALGDLFYFGNVHLCMALGYQDIGQFELAVRFEQQCLDWSLRIGNKPQACWALVNMIDDLRRIGRYDEAEARAQQLLKLVHEIGPSRVFIATYNPLSGLAFDQGDFEQAKTLAKEGLRIGANINYPIARAKALLKLALINCMVHEKYAEAWQLCQEVLPLVNAPHFGVSWIETVMNYAAGNYGLARQNFLVALKAGVALHYVQPRLQLLSTAAVLLAQEGDKERAAELLGLTFNHPATPVHSLEKWPLIIRLRAGLQAELGEAAYAAAWERGKTIDLETVEQSLIDRWEVQIDPQLPQRPLDALTTRELEVLRLVAAGHSNREIAHDLILALSTVKSYIHTIYSKLGVTSRTQAVARARELRLL